MNLLSLVTRHEVSSVSETGREKFHGRGKKFKFLALLAAQMLILSGLSAWAQASVTLAWNASSSPGVTGYRVYQGLASGAYSGVVNAGNATQTVISGLTNDTTYYFAVVAMNSAGLESDFSTEVSYTPPSGRPISPTVTIAANSGTITAPFSISNGIVSQTIQTALAGSGRAVYNFAVANAGAYLVSALVNAPNGGANSFYVNIDAEPIDPQMVWDVPVTTGFESRSVTWTTAGPPKIFNLAAGNHQLIFRGREANVQLSTITISPAGATIELTRIVGGAMLVSGLSDVGKSYEIQASTDLNTWTTLGNVTADGSGLFSYLDTNAPLFPKRFYRLHQLTSGLFGEPSFEITSLPGGLIQLSGAGVASHIYEIQATTDLQKWTAIGTTTADSSGAFSFIDINAPLFPGRYYRVL